MKYLFTTIIALFFLLSSQFVFSQTEITFYTNHGEFVVEMTDTITPITSGNFIKLVNDKFYDGVIFHRVIDNFMIQGGDPTGTGAGGPGYSIEDEFDKRATNVQKTISMANSGPNTGGSQFFINLVNNTYLDYNKNPITSKHPVFGIVVSNFEVVQAIGKVTCNNNRPIKDVIMDSLRVTNAISVLDNSTSYNSVSIFPNPISQESVISINSEVIEFIDICLYNQRGSLISELSESIHSGNNHIPLNKLDINTLSQGVYFVIIKGENHYSKVKFMIIK